MARKISFFDGASSETTPVIGNLIASNLVTYPDDATFEATEQGSPVKGNIYYNTTLDLIRYYNGTSWISVVDESSTQTVQNKTIDGTDATGTNTVTTDASDVTYDPSGSSLVATDDQAALDEVAGRLDTNEGDIDDLETLSGVPGDTDLGVFSGATISDNTTVKPALQELETAVEARIPSSEKAAANGVATLDGTGKLPESQLPASVVGAVVYKGTWNASTNTPTLADPGTQGHYYIVSVAGTQDLGSGSISYDPGDWVISDGTSWAKVDNVDPATTDELTEGSTNLYYTEARVTANTSVTANTAKVSADGSIDTHSDVDTTTVAPTNGQVLEWDGSDWVPGTGGSGSGVGGISYVPAGDSFDAEGGTNGDWALYNDGTATANPPVDGTGGSPSGLALSVDTGGLIRGSNSHWMTYSGAGSQGQGVSIDLESIDTADKNSVLNVKFSYTLSSATSLLDNKLRVYVYDVTNSTLLGPLRNDDDGFVRWYGNNLEVIEMQGQFDTTDGTDYRLIFHYYNGTSVSHSFLFDNIQVGPQQVTPGFFGAKSESFTPAWNNLTIGNGTEEWRHERHGDLLHIHGRTIFGSTTSISGTVTFDNPIPNTTLSDSGHRLKGTVWLKDSGTAANNELALPNVTSNTIRPLSVDDTVMNATNPFTWTTGDIIEVDAWFKIDEWEATAALSTSQSNLQTVKAIYKYTPGGTANVSFADATYETVDFDSKEVDTHNAVTTGASWVFTAPRSGVYQVSTTFAWNTITNLVRTILNLRVNGSIVAALNEGGSQEWGMSGAIAVQLQKGDTLDIQAYQDDSISSGRAPRSSNDRTMVSIISQPDFSTFSVFGKTDLEEISGSLAAYGITVNQWGDLGSITLPLSGSEWDIEMHVYFKSVGATTTGRVYTGIGTTSGNVSPGTEGVDTIGQPMNNTSGQQATLTYQKKGVSGGQTIYLKTYAETSTSNLQAAYRMYARKIK